MDLFSNRGSRTVGSESVNIGNLWILYVPTWHKNKILYLLPAGC